LLVLFATLLFGLQGAVGRWTRRRAAAAGPPSALIPPPLPSSPARWAAALLFQFGVAVYGGYFGAGIGILMLAVLGFLGLGDIHAMNGLKNFFGVCINGVAAA